MRRDPNGGMGVEKMPGGRLIKILVLHYIIWQPQNIIVISHRGW